MDQIKDFISNRSINYSPRYLGWFLFSSTIFVLSHLLLLLYLTYNIIIGLPSFIGILFLWICPGSTAFVAYSGVLAFTENKPLEYLNSDKSDLLVMFLAIMGGVFLLAINVLQWISNSIGNITLILATTLYFVFYLIAGLSGYTFGKHKLFKMWTDDKEVVHPIETDTFEGQRILDAIQIKTEKKAISFAVFTIIISFYIWIEYDFQTGLTAFIAIPGFIRTILYLHPKG